MTGIWVHCFVGIVIAAILVTFISVAPFSDLRTVEFNTIPRLAVVITHPIRYFVPLMQLLSHRGVIHLKAFYTYGPELLERGKYSPVYRDKQEPAVPLYDGYEHEFIENVAKKKSTYRFQGIRNPGLVEKINAYRPDVILVVGWKFQSHLQVMRHFKGKVPVHFRGDSHLLDADRYSWWSRMLRKLALTWVYRHVDMAWCVGTNNRQYYLHFGVPADKLVMVPHAVDNARFQQTPDTTGKAALLRKHLGIPENALVFLYAGRFVTTKGIYDLLAAFEQASMPNAHLLFAGGGPEETKLKQVAATMPQVHFLPFQTQTNMPLVYACADVLVLPTATETWGLVVNEAMAVGLAIIVSDKCGAAADLVVESVNGFTFRYGDVARLQQLLQWCAANTDAVDAMGSASKEQINHFSYAVATAAIEITVTASAQRHAR